MREVIMKGSAMTWTKGERAAELAALAGIAIDSAEADEVAERLESLVRELQKLRTLDLSGIEPVVVFPEARDDDAR